MKPYKKLSPAERALLPHLREDQRTLLELADGRPYAVLQVLVGTNKIGTIKSRLSRPRQALRALAPLPEVSDA